MMLRKHLLMLWDLQWWYLILLKIPSQKQLYSQSREIMNFLQWTFKICHLELRMNKLSYFQENGKIGYLQMLMNSLEAIPTMICWYLIIQMHLIHYEINWKMLESLQWIFNSVILATFTYLVSLMMNLKN